MGYMKYCTIHYTTSTRQQSLAVFPLSLAGRDKDVIPAYFRTQAYVPQPLCGRVRARLSKKRVRHHNQQTYREKISITQPQHVVPIE